MFTLSLYEEKTGVQKDYRFTNPATFFFFKAEKMCEKHIS